MSSNKKKVSKEEPKKVSAKGLKNVINAIGRRIFSKVHKNEVEYGQTLSKKRRKNCILKSVSSLSCPEDNTRLTHSPYEINFKFSREDFNYRGSVANFQKIDLEDSCCQKCLYTLKKEKNFSRFSISSDSACEVSSESSCDDMNCKYRKTRTKRKTKSKSSGDVSKHGAKSLENFIRLHNENFERGIINPACETRFTAPNSENSLLDWNEEPKYESLISRLEEIRPNVDDSDYDILVTGPNYKVMEPSYENLKLIENFYEMPQCREKPSYNSDDETTEKTREVIQSNRSYDEVIESLKLWHMSSRYPEDGNNCSCCGEKLENEYNHCLEGYESLENDFNNDIEEFCC